jgi:preprotein translocase subunit YajC
MAALLPLILLVAVSYVLLIRPQQRQLRSRRALVASLGVGDEVVTAGGVVGRIMSLDDTMATLEVADGVRVRILRGAVSQRLGPEREEPEEPDESATGVDVDGSEGI